MDLFGSSESNATSSSFGAANSSSSAPSSLSHTLTSLLTSSTALSSSSSSTASSDPDTLITAADSTYSNFTEIFLGGLSFFISVSVILVILGFALKQAERMKREQRRAGGGWEKGERAFSRGAAERGRAPS
ncbi:hypothetical protein BCR35DRAFT_188143 [Leucosporidium creatinivorum]|uniref:Uncharacterized protein n=1 Tax=Leucosporidium creatinivorum TaxID=106004 RepID=A0A1Y2DWN2_9BASI|nr:hypothetical protein BCR35DRAFT_188143 [Leucosporidium creatinivorum]